MRTRVKICGITRAADARAAVAAGADALGLVFCDSSPRAIDLQQARAIVAEVPAFVALVGLFVDPHPAHVECALESLELDTIQFHGDESPEFCASFGRRYIKAVPMGGGVDPPAYVARYAGASGFVFDSHRLGERGGLGKCFAHEATPEGVRGTVIAGGLNPTNVAGVIQRMRPFAVDVSSGVEQRPGLKDPGLMARFLAEVQRGDSNRE
ncbi:phosphoribosylanthranilate isomerase [Halorhodospira abdelmalekii]|uniref:phosphoribosylanthranilate isomerase n=1 Tax=Halorhodospira abdelmalekii TaxID=421629 RepID=UPI0019045ED5|nr:phosphoribosylanthranilate isomerase [Halorhodospira abdelmalekii]